MSVSFLPRVSSSIFLNTLKQRHRWRGHKCTNCLLLIPYFSSSFSPSLVYCSFSHRSLCSDLKSIIYYIIYNYDFGITQKQYINEQERSHRKTKNQWRASVVLFARVCTHFFLFHHQKRKDFESFSCQKKKEISERGKKRIFIHNIKSEKRERERGRRKRIVLYLSFDEIAPRVIHNTHKILPCLLIKKKLSSKSFERKKNSI